jgi:hypothetical protein
MNSHPKRLVTNRLWEMADLVEVDREQERTRNNILILKTERAISACGGDARQALKAA